jgi:hypothetical protein
MKLDLCREIQQPITIGSLGVAFSQYPQLWLGSGTRCFCPDQFSAEQFGHVVSSSQGKSVVWKTLTRWCVNKVGESCTVYDIDSEWRRQTARSSFAGFPRQLVSSALYHMILLEPPTPHTPACCTAFFWIDFTQALREKERIIVS